MATTSTTRSTTATRLSLGQKTALLLGLAVAVVLAAIALVALALSRYQYQAGLEQLKGNQLTAAGHSFAAAAGFLPQFLRRSLDDPGQNPPILRNDLQRLSVASGHLAFKKAAESKDASAFQQGMLAAKQKYQIACQLNPLDVEALTGLTRTLTALEKIQPYLKPGTPAAEQALPLYEKLLRLRPKGIEIHYLFIRYLHGRKLEERLLATITQLMAIHPPSFAQIVKEKFYSPELRYAAQQGLETAIAAGNFVGSAYAGLSAIAVEKGDTAQAVKLYEQGMLVDPGKNIAGQHAHLGALQLKTGQSDLAQSHFLIALKNSAERDKLLRSIWAIYHESKKHQQFLALCRDVEKEVAVSELVDILQAVCYAEMDQYELARAHLNQVDEVKYQAEAMYQLALISQKLKDWDGMELASQRATMLESSNSGYHALFAQSLRNQRKNASAEEAMTRALATAKTEDPWQYTLRGWTRFDQNNIEGARQDWQKAVALAPTVGHFYRYLSLTYAKEGDWLAALKYLKKAVELNPENNDYRKALQELQEKMR